MGRRGTAGIVEQVDFGSAELVPDADRPGGWTLLLDGVQHSYVDVEEPRHLEFEYVRRLASVVDAAAPPGRPLRVLHLGGGALTLPRYVAATRPGSVQRAVERDAALTALVRKVLPLPRNADLRVRVADARDAVEGSGPDRHDLVIADVYSDSRMPSRFASVEFAAEVARVLRPGGWYAVNLADAAPLSFSRGQVATLREVFDDVCLMAEPGVLRGRRFGNVVLAAGSDLPVAALARSAATEVFPARLLHGADLDRFIAGTRPVTDATAVASPAPPSDLFG
ncbi:fused MFS/spermidine synthase [Rugosimonospora acidiphila]|uniref:Fused MFS/spermidine synthase n=1 Tax=Rugosimonospora acidiphila TaxID=556531 RepID=A0ABP9RXM4_9ACTN